MRSRTRDPCVEGLRVGKIVGIDFSEASIQIAKTRYPEYDFRVGNILNLREVVSDEKFDGFVAITSLMHILPENMQQAVISIRDVVRTGAIGFITTPYGDREELLDAANLDTDGGIIPEGQYMFRNLWNPTTLMAYFKLGGFEVIAPTFNDGYMIRMTVLAI